MIARRLAAELLGTAFLLMAIVGSGIVVGDEPSAALALFIHAVIIGATLTALILTFGPVSGAHFNPVVTTVDAIFGGLSRGLAAAYVAAQLAGAVAGVVLANVMFSLPAVALATNDRIGAGLVGSEVLATFGLLVVIFGMVRSGSPGAIPAAVGAYITGAIIFTSSDAFANPAVTVARMLTDTYVAITPRSVPAYLLAQILGAALATGLIAWMFRPDPATASDVVVPQDEPAQTGATR